MERVIEIYHGSYARRIGFNLFTETMYTEFEVFLTTILRGIDWWNDIWEVVEYVDQKEIQGLSTSRECLCSHKIRNHCYIAHRPTGVSFLVGSCCMLKVLSPDMKKKLKDFIDRKKYKKEGCWEEKREKREKKLLDKRIKESARQAPDRKFFLMVRELKERFGLIVLCKDCKKDITAENKLHSWKVRCIKCWKTWKGK